MSIGNKTKELLKQRFSIALPTVDLSIGDMVRISREFSELSQNQLAQKTQIPQSTISAIENNRIKLGVERAKTLARALKVHPAVLLFPNWDVDKESAA
jgi:ribosome-binding protein aMBF1 (putative translation factor)